MKINTLICGLLLGVLFCSCGDNEASSPSNMEKNWYVIEYDPNASELDKLRYEIYDETGFAIFYNDTLGVQTRYDKGGKPYTYYEIFQPGYNFSSSFSSSKMSLLCDEGKLYTMVELLRDDVLLPYFNKPVARGRYGPHAFLIVDSLYKIENKKVILDTLKWDLGILVLSTRSMMTKEIVNNVNIYKSIDELTEEDKKEYGWRIAMLELQRYLEKNYGDEITAYYDITKESPDLDGYPHDLFEIAEKAKSYNYKQSATNNGIKEYNFELDNPRKYGVLRFMKVDANNVHFPSCLMDISEFTRMIYTKTDVEIRAEHGEFPMIIKRYEALLNLLKKSGLTQFIKEQ